MDAAEFDAFHTGTYPRLLTALATTTGDPGRAQDALDEAYVAAWTRHRTLGHDVPAETWVRDAAAHRLGVDPSSVVGRDQDLEVVRHTLAALPRPPLPVAEIRHRGDSRARRRRAWVAVLAAVGLVVATTGLVLTLPGGSGGGSGPDDLRIQEDDPVRERL